MRYKYTLFEQDGIWHWSIIDEYEQQEVASTNKGFKNMGEALQDARAAVSDWNKIN